MTVQTKGAVTASARAIFESIKMLPWAAATPAEKEQFRYVARAALDAAMPHLTKEHAA